MPGRKRPSHKHRWRLATPGLEHEAGVGTTLTEQCYQYDWRPPGRVEGCQAVRTMRAGPDRQVINITIRYSGGTAAERKPTRADQRYFQGEAARHSKSKEAD